MGQRAGAVHHILTEQEKKMATNRPASSESKEPLKLWVNSGYYIPVDKDGRCIGVCAEGALGFVIQLRPRGEGKLLALKIPRLMGETHRENAYINELTQKESWAVQQINLGNGLLPAQASDVLRGPINTAGGTDDAAQWNGALVFVRFDKSRNPVFCLVKRNGNDKGLSFFPPMTQDRPIASVARLSEIENKARIPAINEASIAWGQTVLVQDGDTSDMRDRERPSVISSLETLNEQQIASTWYTNLPSVLYNWASGTLQESIGNRKRGVWGIGDHLRLIERVCQGLSLLHESGQLHADIRPANIVYTNNKPTDPNYYFLADYGSFAETVARPAGRPNSPVGSLGPTVAGERVSEFYAPERRLGREREAADTAVVINPGGGTVYLVLGWKNDLLDAATGNPKKDLLDSLRKDIGEADEKWKGPKSAGPLSTGDRIQLRDYIFDVDKEWNVDNRQILSCRLPFWKVYQGRIVVRSDDKLTDGDTFPIPRSVELLHWSVATDIYSLGALALYSVFRDENPVLVQETSTTSDRVGPFHREPLTDSDDAVGLVQRDDSFRHMLEGLANPPYFATIWFELALLTKQIEENLMDDERNKGPIDFGERTYVRPDNSTLQDISGERIDNLRKAAKHLAGRICQTVPGVRELVSKLDCNLGQFVLYIHFVLSCLHRQDSLGSEVRASDEMRLEKPFCLTRHDLPQNQEAGPATHAMTRIKLLSQLMYHPLLKGLQFREDEIPRYDPRLDSDIRLQLERETAKVARQAAELVKAVTELQNSRDTIERMTSDLQRASAEAANREADLAEAVHALQRSRVCQADLQSQLASSEVMRSETVKILREAGMLEKLSPTIKQAIDRLEAGAPSLPTDVVDR